MSGGEAVKGPRMEHTRLRKPLCGKFETTDPGVPVSLTTTLERLPPVAEHALSEYPHTVEVSRYSIVVEVPLYD
jgi:hypothetical protein